MSDVMAFLPAKTRAALQELGRKMGVSDAALMGAVLAQDALRGLSAEDRRKALAVLIVLEGRR